MKLRAKEWFDDPGNPGMTARHAGRRLSNGLALEELQSDKLACLDWLTTTFAINGEIMI